MVAPANPGADFQATKVTEHARTRVKAKSLFSKCNLSPPPIPPTKRASESDKEQGTGYQTRGSSQWHTGEQRQEMLGGGEGGEQVGMGAAEGRGSFHPLSSRRSNRKLLPETKRGSTPDARGDFWGPALSSDNVTGICKDTGAHCTVLFEARCPVLNEPSRSRDVRLATHSEQGVL